MSTPDRIAIEKLDGTLVSERHAPRDSFAGHQMSTPWDALHLAYFNGEALWTYFTTPFLLAMDGVHVEEGEPWQEGAETWRVLRAQFPGSLETHSLSVANCQIGLSAVVFEVLILLPGCVTCSSSSFI